MKKTTLGAAVLLLAALGSGCARETATRPDGPIHGSQPLAFALPLFPSGSLHDLASDRGSVVLLDVWATWCEPCRDSLPAYEQLLRTYGPRGLKVYAINVDEDPREVHKFVEATKLTLPILLDQNAAAAERTLQVRVMPSTYLLDRRGVVRFVHEGFSEDFLLKYPAQIEQLLQEPQ